MKKHSLEYRILNLQTFQLALVDKLRKKGILTDHDIEDMDNEWNRVEDNMRNKGELE